MQPGVGQADDEQCDDCVSSQLMVLRKAVERPPEVLGGVRAEPRKQSEKLCATDRSDRNEIMKFPH